MTGSSWKDCGVERATRVVRQPRRPSLRLLPQGVSAPRLPIAGVRCAERNGVRMEIVTTRFGTLNVEDERVIDFPKGLLGFPDRTRYALIQTGEENYFFWLQCVDEPNLAFVVTDP